MAQSIVITGASSGIGKALALAYAAQGATLGLIGRDSGRLAAVAAQCAALGAQVRTGQFDVRAREALARWLEDYDSEAPVDLLVANAGVTGGTAPGAEIESAQASAALMEINTLGTLNTVHPLLPRMMARRRGQIAIVSSIAAFVPLPDTPSYSASKAALLQYGLAIRARLRKHGIRVSVICPGYVSTPMADRSIGAKPFEISTEAAVRHIRRGLARDKAVIAFPMTLALLARFGAMLPDALRRRALKPFGFRVAAALKRERAGLYPPS